MPSIIRFLIIFAIFAGSLARAGEIALVLSDEGAAYSEFSGALSESLKASPWHLTPYAADSTAVPSRETTDLTVTVGSEALRRTLARGDSGPILATLLPRQSYEKLLAEFRRPAGRITAIYLDQPPARQAAFLRHLLPGNKRFGILFSTESRHLATAYRQAFANSGLTLDSEDADTGSTLLPAINVLLPRVAALLALPDSTIFQRSNIKPILISAYRLQKPVVAYSPAFVNAGALAALHSTPTQIAQQTAELILANPVNLPPPSPPARFSIAINRTVAQAFNLNIPDDSVLYRAVLADRQSP